MTDYALDTYTDTDWKPLVSHAPTLGGPIVKHPTGGGDWYTVGGRALCRAPGVNYYNATPASADYTVQADIRILSSIGSAGVVGRVNPGTGTWYHAYLAPGNDELVLAKWVGGYASNIESKFGMGFSSNATYTLALEMIGTALNVYINGVLEIDNTDSSITAAGKGGIRAGVISDTGTGKHIDNFRIYDTTTPPVAPAGRSFGRIIGL